MKINKEKKEEEKKPKTLNLFDCLVFVIGIITAILYSIAIDNHHTELAVKYSIISFFSFFYIIHRICTNAFYNWDNGFFH